MICYQRFVVATTRLDSTVLQRMFLDFFWRLCRIMLRSILKQSKTTEFRSCRSDFEQPPISLGTFCAVENNDASCRNAPLMKRTHRVGRRLYGERLPAHGENA